MKVAKTWFEIVPLSEVPTKRRPVERVKPSQAQLKKVPHNKNDGR
jgi:hypothetical protein